MTANGTAAREIGLIWAQTEQGGVIGKDGSMPWHVPEDMKHFAATTSGHPVVMGRRTWDSIPERFRPFSHRTNIVITRQQGWEASGAVVVHSLPDALAAAAQAPGAERVWVIGGGTVFEEVLPLADIAAVTLLDLDVDGDTFAPHLGADWRLASVQPDDGGWLSSRTGVPYRIAWFRRAATAQE